MNTKATLNKLKERLGLIKAYEATSITFGKHKVAKKVGDQVKREVKEYIKRRIIEIDSGVEIDTGLTKADVDLLKILVEKVRGRAGSSGVQLPKSHVKKQRAAPTNDQVGQGLITNIMQERARANVQMAHEGKPVQVLAKSGKFAVVRDESGKYKVPVSELCKVD